MPDFSFEEKCRGTVAGIDEAGRGPLAGPVIAAAIILNRRRLAPEILAGIDDSKKLSKPAREAMFEVLITCARIGLGAASVSEIDHINIHHATLLAMRRAVAMLDPAPKFALVDGKFAPKIACRVRTIVDGDALCFSIAAASIIAKVTRDKLMTKLALLYPGFGFDRNAGYGTPEHLLALEAHGPTPHHRRSFSPVLKILSPKKSLPLGI
ncbi:MAG: ribonuclease HII [Alphaproteobacteria bacterium]